MTKTIKRALIIGGIALLLVFGSNAVRGGMFIFATALGFLFLLAKAAGGSKN